MPTSVHLRFVLLVLGWFWAITALGQQTTGMVVHGQEGIPYASIHCQCGTVQKGTMANANGQFLFPDLPDTLCAFTVTSLGYKPHTIRQRAGKFVTIELEADVLGKEEVVVTASKANSKRSQAPVLVNVVSARTMAAAQAATMGEGLNYSPGVRVENNCQNCGFSAVRLNGLQGPYTQVLVNSRPVYSALTSIYGLEQIPASLIDKIEVVRGAGSVLYGGNAIAGTVNVLTREPLFSGWQAGTTTYLTGMKSLDRLASANGSVVAANDRSGFSLYGLARDRQEYDANGDDYSEITRLRNQTIGFSSFHKLANDDKVKLSGFAMNEYRRGGNNLDLPPHQTDIAEELKTTAYNLSAQYDHTGTWYQLSLFSSIQTTHRQSYYGGGGRIIGAGDTVTSRDILALNAYGRTSDFISNLGFQLSNRFDSTRLTWVAGMDWNRNVVTDLMPGYKRAIDQNANTLGAYGQLTYALRPNLQLVAGIRGDLIWLVGRYQYDQQLVNNRYASLIVVPRLAMAYNPTPASKIRVGYAQGYRAPQAFDEDLHVETVQGTARFIQLSPDLVPERSHSLTASYAADWETDHWDHDWIVEAFGTWLPNAFVNQDITVSQAGYATWLKTNGSGMRVLGLNAEWRAKPNYPIDYTVGITCQQASYQDPIVLWQVHDSVVSSRNVLRTPSIYGFLSSEYEPRPGTKVQLTGLFTGAMQVAHQLNATTGYTAIVGTPQFFDLNLKVSHRFSIADELKAEVAVGCQNLLNSYQRDFDRGAFRDASYIYGPGKPATLFVALRIGNFLGI